MSDSLVNLQFSQCELSDILFLNFAELIFNIIHTYINTETNLEILNILPKLKKN
jgi:hypothetical protein